MTEGWRLNTGSCHQFGWLVLFSESDCPKWRNGCHVDFRQKKEKTPPPAVTDEQKPWKWSDISVWLCFWSFQSESTFWFFWFSFCLVVLSQKVITSYFPVLWALRLKYVTTSAGSKFPAPLAPWLAQHSACSPWPRPTWRYARARGRATRTDTGGGRSCS